MVLENEKKIILTYRKDQMSWLIRCIQDAHEKEYCLLFLIFMQSKYKKKYHVQYRLN